MSELAVHLAGSLIESRRVAVDDGWAGVDLLAAGLDQPKIDSWRPVDATPRPAWRRPAEPGFSLEGQVPLVLLHAFPLSSEMFEACLAYLGRQPVVMIDLPGFGFSPVIEPVSITEATAAVARTLGQIGVSRAVVAGVSMGGYVTLALLRDYPDLIEGVVLAHTKAVADDEEAKARRLEIARSALAEGGPGPVMGLAKAMISPAVQEAQPSLVARVEGWIKGATPEGIAWAQTAMAGRPDTMGVLRATGLPVTAIAGGDDLFAPVAEAEAMVEAAGPEANLTVIAGVGHLSPVEAPYLAATLLREAYIRSIQA